MKNRIVTEMRALSEAGIKCSQIMIALALKQQGKQDADLIRAMGGLVVGVGYSGKICGALTGGACLISFYAGRGDITEKEHPKLWPMIEEYVEWFESEVGENNGEIDCDKILERAGVSKPGPEICGPIVLKAYMKSLSILETNAIKIMKGEVKDP
ncbi:MAG: C-GCAxxG-C-C family protein [Desulfocapsa sp.]|nr:C-GCAxxG-C-C family protein [Desulfocapsa sp.]